MINFLFFALLVIAVLLAIRFAVHRFYPGWGTTWAGLVGAAGALFEQGLQVLPNVLTEGQKLPWEKILGSANANAVVFGCMVAMVILRNVPRKAGA
jgi:hypothetical protein